MNTVKIEDMPVAEELSSEKMAAVHGGFYSVQHTVMVDSIGVPVVYPPATCPLDR